MRIIVCVKQVPDTNEVRIDPVKGTLIRDGVPSILNPDDAVALEAALSLREAEPDATVTVLSMGPPQAEAALRECLAMGADEACLLSARAFGGADTCATSVTLAAGVRRLGGADLILAGRQAIDGDTAQVGPQLAGRLGLPVVTYVDAIEHSANGKLTVRRRLEDGYERLTLPTPCVLTIVQELGAPRYMSISGIFAAYEKPIAVYNEKDVGLAPEQCGLKASPTQVLRSFTPAPKGKGEFISGAPNVAARTLVAHLAEKHLIHKEG